MLGAAELRLRCASVGRFLANANRSLDRLHGLVGSSGCGVLLTDSDGVVLDQRCSPADALVFKEWGLWQGADWSEEAEGTNGIGTCLSENRQVIVHRDEHFHARNIAMSCIDAPVYGPRGELLGALDVSSARADQTACLNALIGATVHQAAKQIEADLFRAEFSQARIVVVEGGHVGSGLFAIDKDDIVVGATRDARKSFGLPLSGLFAPRPAYDLLIGEQSVPDFEEAAKSVVVQALARSGGNVSKAARTLGIGRTTLYRRMKRLRIS
ncbi:MAG: helix-turn-helix domain-containing protein [Pseudomonadota bacterium]